ncbi:MAG TPA: efflux RND transporter periplasmic adaptor subunit [Steroidobacteraceae bacterium]
MTELRLGGSARSALEAPHVRLLMVVGVLLVITIIVLAVRRTIIASRPVVQVTALPIVTVMTPSLQTVVQKVSFTGTIAARYDMPIGLEGETGRIAAVLVEAGDHVKRGQVLARLDDSTVRPRMASLAASLEQSRAEAELAQAEYQRAQAVEASGALSKEEIERRRSTAVTAEAKVRVAQAQLEESRAQLGRTDIRSPTDGLVLTRSAEVGQIASPGSAALFRIARDGEVELRGQVAEQDMPLLHVGQPTTVHLTAVETPFEGTVRLLGAVIDPQSRLGEIRIALTAGPNLRPGAFARGEVSVNNSRRPLLPRTAVLADAQGSYVYVVGADNRVERRAVRTAGTYPSGVAIAEGLSGSERVVASAGAFLRAGEKIIVAGSPAASAGA